MSENETALYHVNHIFTPVLLVLLLCADVAFALLHVSYRLLSLPNELLSLKTDGGYSEVFQYIKELWIAIVLFAVCWRRREGIYAIWALLFAYLLCDDALTIHERAGSVYASHWQYVPALGLRPQDFGELTYLVAAGSVFLVLITYCYRRCTDDGRNVSRDLLLLCGLLVFFGSFVDMAHIALPVKGLSIVEESGEMIAMSLIVSYVVHLLDRQGHGSGLLWRSAIAPVTRRCSRRAKPRS